MPTLELDGITMSETLLIDVRNISSNLFEFIRRGPVFLQTFSVLIGAFLRRPSFLHVSLIVSNRKNSQDEAPGPRCRKDLPARRPKSKTSRFLPLLCLATDVLLVSNYPSTLR